MSFRSAEIVARLSSVLNEYGMPSVSTSDNDPKFGCLPSNGLNCSTVRNSDPYPSVLSECFAISRPKSKSNDASVAAFVSAAFVVCSK